MFEYHLLADTNIILHGSQNDQVVRFAMSTLEFVDIALSRFLHTAQHGLCFSELEHPALIKFRHGVLVPVPSFKRIVVDNVVPLPMFTGSNIYFALAAFVWERPDDLA